MIARGIRLTGLRREALAALTPGRGESVDALKRRVGSLRGLDPAAPGWGSFATSLVRTLRLLEARGLVELERAVTLFGKPCTSWVRLTETGESERARAAARGEHALASTGLFCEDPPGDLWDRLGPELRRASDVELERFLERARDEVARRAGRTSYSEACASAPTRSSPRSDAAAAASSSRRGAPEASASP